MILFLLIALMASLGLLGALALIHRTVRWRYIGVLQILAVGACLWSVFYAAAKLPGAFQ